MGGIDTDVVDGARNCEDDVGGRESIFPVKKSRLERWNSLAEEAIDEMLWMELLRDMEMDWRLRLRARCSWADLLCEGARSGISGEPSPEALRVEAWD